MLWWFVGVMVWAEGTTAAAEPCVPDGPAESISVEAGSRVTVASGLQARVVGLQWDHFDDGRFDHTIELQLQRGAAEETAIVSALAPAKYRATLGHCWRVDGVTGDRVQLSIAMEKDGTAPPPACTAPSELPVFESFFDAEEGARFQARLSYDAEHHEWRVTPTPTFLPHHATRLHWSNLETTGLGRVRDETVRVELQLRTSDIQKVPDRHQWRATHTATLTSVCRVP